MKRLVMFTLVLLAVACATARPRVTLPAGDPLSPHSTYRPADDGAHPSNEPGYFEWWYFDATFEDGTSATVSLYAAQMFSGDRKPAVLVNLLDGLGKSRAAYQTHRPDSLTLGRPGEIRVGESSSQLQPDGSLRVVAFAKTEDGEALSVDLTFRGTMPGFKPGDGEVRLDGKVALGWVVPMPRAAVEGVVRVGGAERRVRGAGYHDHNWGELNLLDTMGYWYWGRLTSDDTTVVYANVNFRESLGVRPLTMVAMGDASRFRKVDVAPEFVPVAKSFLASANRAVPRGLVIRSPQLALRLTSVKTLDSLDLSRSAPWFLRPLVRRVTRPAYVRQLCDYQLITEVEGLPAVSSGRGISEYMYVYRR